MKLILLFISVAFLFSCQRETKFKTVKHFNVYSIDVPENFKELIFLGSNSDFHLGNKPDDFYITITTENIKELKEVGLDYDLETYASLGVTSNSNNLQIGDLINIDEKVVIANRMKKKSAHIISNDKLTNQSAFNYLSFYKSKSNFYVIATWCSTENQSKYQNIMKRMHDSFKEL